MKNKNKLIKKFRDYLRTEIAIEYKACLYFACILFFYFAYLMSRRVYSASILFMFEMIMTAYVMSYLQVYLFCDTDVADRPGTKGLLGILVCAGLYGAASFWLGWFEESFLASFMFVGYMLLIYSCVWLLNRMKRALDTEHLNKMLSEFKEKGRNPGSRDKAERKEGEEYE